MDNLPEGYTLDQPTNSSALPPGFVLDNPSPDFWDRLSSDLSSRKNTAKLALLDMGMQPDMASGMYKAAIATPQILGAAFGGAGDVANNALGSVARTVAPQNFQTLQNDVSSTLKPIGEAIKPTLDYAKENAPDAYKVASGFANELGGVASLEGGQALANITGIPKLAGSGLEKAGDILQTSGNKAAQDAHLAATTDFIQPAQTAKVLREGAKKQGIDIDTGSVNQTPKDQAVINTVSKVPGLDFQKNDIGQNLAAVVKENTNEAENLKPKLARVNVPVSNFQKGLQDIKDNITNTEGIDDAERNARLAAVDKMTQITNRKSGNITGPELLEARQKLDRTFLTTNGDLTSAAEKNYQNGIKPIRDYTNNYIAEQAPQADVLTSLQKQSHLRTAIDNVATKIPSAVKEAQDAPGWFARNTTNLGVGALGIGELAHIYPELANTLESYGPALAGLGALAKGGKYALSTAGKPIVKKGLGKTLSTTGQALQGKL